MGGMNRDTALLLIDTQTHYFSSHPVYDSDALLSRLVDLLAQARANHLVIAYTQNNGEPQAEDAPHTDGWEIHPALGPQEGNVVVQKEAADAFQQTPLAAELDARGVQRLVVAGLPSELGVDSSVRTAAALGYRVTLVADGHSTHDAGLRAAQIIAHHNELLGRFAHVTPLASLDLMRGTVVAELELAEPFSLVDLGALRKGLAEVSNGRIHYGHPITILNALRHVWDPAFRPPPLRLAPAEWQIGMTEIFQDGLRRLNPAWQKLVGAEVLAVVQKMLKSVLQIPDGQTRLICQNNPLWCYQAPLFRLIYHQDNDRRTITILAIADNPPLLGESAMDQFRKRFGLDRPPAD